jgi:hypothetical protein
MSDTALIQVVSKIPTVQNISPVCYLHSSGSVAHEYIRELALLMSPTRGGDVQYGFARLVGICHTHIGGNLSLGVWAADGILTAEHSHGDAGVFVVDCNTWDVRAEGGYGESFNALDF